MRASNELYTYRAKSLVLLQCPEVTCRAVIQVNRDNKFSLNNVFRLGSKR